MIYFVPRVEYKSAVFNKDAYLILKGRPLLNNEEPAEAGLLNQHLKGLVSKLNILRSFSAATPDLLLAEQIEEATESETSVQVKIIDGPVQKAEVKVIVRLS